MNTRQQVAGTRSAVGVLRAPVARARAMLALGALLVLCLAHGLHVTAGLQAPPDLDALRDIGFAQGLLDGNWFGDPAYADAARYYPPLVPALAAGTAWLLGGADLPTLWVRVGPWVGLLPVLACFGFARRLLAADAPAVAVAAVFALWNGSLADPWLAGGYAPWLLTPLLVQAGFLATAGLIHARVAAARWQDAALIGAAMGLTFLGHVVPALLLSAMLAAAAVAVQGLRLRTLAWLAVAAIVKFAVAAPYLLPLLLMHPQGVVHTAPGAWMPYLLQPEAASVNDMLLRNLPMAAALLVAWPVLARLGAAARAMLATWVGTCLLMLIRHYECAGAPGAACQVLAMPAHHFHLYLQVAAALPIGVMLWMLVAPGRGMAHGAAVALLLLLTGGIVFLQRPYDAYARQTATEAPFDAQAYRWILASTPPDAVILAPAAGPDGEPHPAAFVAMAAGRRLLATHGLFSNPYVAWTPREHRRHAALDWLAGEGQACDAPRLPAWAILPAASPVPPSRGVFALRTGSHVVYAVPAPCW